MMELSSVFNRIHFLLELTNAPGNDRIIMLEYLALRQMACIGEIARKISKYISFVDSRPGLFRGQKLSVTRIILIKGIFSWKSSHTSSLPQNLVKTSTKVLPPGHNPRSNTISTRILVCHNMRSRWWWSSGGGGGGCGGGGCGGVVVVVVVVEWWLWLWW